MESRPFDKLGRVENESEIVPAEGHPEIDPRLIAVVHPTPDNPPWNSPTAIAMWIASVFAILLVPSIFVLPYLFSNGPPYSDRQAVGQFVQQDPVAILLQIGAIIPAHILTLVLAWAIVTRLDKFSFRKTLGWESGGMTWRHYVGIPVAFMIVSAVVGNYFPQEENELTRILGSSRWALFLVVFLATLTAPLVEELIYRGILYSAFRRSVGTAAAVGSVTLLFVLVHVPQYYPSYSTIFLLLLLSLMLTVVRARTGNLLPCIILHTILNAIQSILLILQPYIDSAKPVIEPTAGFFLK